MTSGSGGGDGGAKDGGFIKNSKAAKGDIVRADIPIDGSTSTGHALASFQFQIPNHLPSSMFFKDKSGGHCSIRYKVKLVRSNKGRGCRRQAYEFDPHVVS